MLIPEVRLAVPVLLLMEGHLENNRNLNSICNNNTQSIRQQYIAVKLQTPRLTGQKYVDTI